MVSKIEEKAHIQQEIAAKHMYQPSEEAKKDSAQDMASKIAQDIVNKKMGCSIIRLSTRRNMKKRQSLWMRS